MTPDHATTLAALLGSRICHDLISPIGAISNGVELLGLSAGGTDNAELSLISDSVDNANAKVKFFRIALGQASEGQVTGQQEIKKIFEGLSSPRLELNWEAQGDLPREEVKLACLLEMCLETALPRGGKITVGHRDGVWEVLARAERIEADPSLWARLGTVTSPAGLSPNQVQFVLAPMQAKGLGRKITHSGDGEVLKLTV